MDISLSTQSPGHSDSPAQLKTSSSNLDLLPSLSPPECELAKSSVMDSFSTPPSSPTRPTNIKSNQESVESESHKNIGNVSSSIQQEREIMKDHNLNCNLRIIHIFQIPPECHYEVIFLAFKQFGKISEIRMNFKEEILKWEAWVSFEKHENAFSASCNLSNIQICNSVLDGALCDSLPKISLDVYKPAEWCEKEDSPITQKIIAPRVPKPPQWLIATGKEENYNYFKFSKYLQKKVGSIKCGDITRFGKTSVLVREKSRTQSIMLSNFKTEESEMLVNIKPHLNFSYARGVIFNRDLYEFSEDEILEMCPKQIWKVHKIPKTTMIIVTFEDDNIPSHVYIENERIPVRFYKQKPLQCYNCFKFGHPSRVCKNDRLCGNCSAPAHGECSLVSKCINCDGCHKSTDKKCGFFQSETAALLKADAEHISISYARRLISKNMNYAKALKPNTSKSNLGHNGTHVEISQNAFKTGAVAKALTHSRIVLNSNLGTKPSTSPPPHTKMSSPRLSSQAFSLPDLGEDLSTGGLLHAPLTPRGHALGSPVSPQSNAGGGSPPPLHPPHVKHLGVSTSNRFEILSSPDQVSESPDVLKEHKISVELHHPPHKFNKVHNVKSFKPRISRPLFTKKPPGSASKTKPLPQRTSRKESSNV